MGGVIMSGGKVVLLVFGIIASVVAIGLFLAGGFAVWLDTARTDSEGFITTGTINLDRDSHAIVTEPVEIEIRGAWWAWDGFATIKVEGSTDAPSSKQIFIGIAEDSDVKAYLNNVAYDEIDSWSIWPHKVEYDSYSGSAVPVAPATQAFWIVSAHGAGTQTLEWELEDGTYMLVLMNDDGSTGVDLSIKLGAKVSWLIWAGVGLLIGGAVAAIGGSLMIYFAVRRGTPKAPAS
jgi:hypothetical protein